MLMKLLFGLFTVALMSGAKLLDIISQQHKEDREYLCACIKTDYDYRSFGSKNYENFCSTYNAINACTAVNPDLQKYSRPAAYTIAKKEDTRMVPASFVWNYMHKKLSDCAIKPKVEYNKDSGFDFAVNVMSENLCANQRTKKTKQHSRKKRATKNRGKRQTTKN